ncbi:hypothetical protein [Rhodovulum sp. PH10]|uniref:hypothetical protein n=1 Tax=Rhodovulum sp. PH10 TaxID=1187851 RepID=UPI00058D130D|nr:hypothetical protein [Rhodovulum sp. PH10]
MTSDDRKKRELLDLVERKAFDPVMHARPDGRSPADRDALEEVKRKTESEIERYRGYDSAATLVANFERDLTSEPAKRVHAELRRLDLPTIEDIRDEFERKAADLGVGA